MMKLIYSGPIPPKNCEYYTQYPLRAGKILLVGPFRSVQHCKIWHESDPGESFRLQHKVLKHGHKAPGAILQKSLYSELLSADSKLVQIEVLQESRPRLSLVA